MHDGCNANFVNGKAVVNKLRAMNFSAGEMPVPHAVTCECGEVFKMETFEAKCPKCNMVYGVTPCHAGDADSIMAAGIDF